MIPRFIFCLSVFLAFVPPLVFAQSPSADDLIAIIQSAKSEPSQKEIAATDLAKRFPASHARFLELYRAEPLMRVRRVMLKQMTGQRMPGLAEAAEITMGAPEALLRSTATDALPAIADNARFLPLLTKALDDLDPEVRWVAAKVYAGSAKAITVMPDRAGQLARHDDPLLRQAFFAHLAGQPETRTIVVPLVSAALLNPDPATCLSAAARANVTLFASDEKARDAERQAVIDSLTLRLGLGEAEIAGAAGGALWLIWGPAVESAVRAALASENLLQRARAADLLRKKKATFDPVVLADVFKKGGEGARLYVLGTLGRMQTAECVPVAAMGLADESPAVRQAAVYGLEVMNFAPAREALVSALNHADANVRLRATIVLGRRPDAGKAAAALKKTAESDSDPAVRDAAKIAAAVASGGDLAGVLADPDALFAEAAKLKPRIYDVAAGKPTVLSDGVAQVGSQKQLLVDDLVIDRIEGADRVLHEFRKDPRNPVLEQQFPWEVMGTLSYCTTVRYDPATRLFSFWYTSFGRLSDAGEAIGSRAQCLAYSIDGIHWSRPALRQQTFGGSPVTNLVGRAPSIVHLPEEKDPARRFASYRYVPEVNGLGVSFSPDGMDGWTDWKFVCGGGNDVDTVCRDDLGGGLFSFMKWRFGRWFRRAAWPAWGATPDAFKRGLINVTAGFADDRGSMNRVAAAFPGLDFYKPEMMRAEIYEVVPFIYEGIYFGFPVRFDVSGSGARNVDGPTDLTLQFCRDKDGKGGWLRPGTPDYLKATTGDAELEAVERLVSPLTGVLDFGRWGEWDATQHYGPSSVLVVGDEIVLYYCAGSFGHEPEGSRSDGAGKNVYRTAIGRATLRLDGLVSLRAATDRSAVVTTKPLGFSGRELVLNAACPKGELKAELLDAEGRPLPGFGLAESDAFTGDALRHVATWKGKSDLSALAGKTLRLRVSWRGGDWYSFHFRS
jgi:HEAT repeat protein